MQNVRTLQQPAPATDRLSLKLSLLFVGTFLVVFILLAAWTMLETIWDRQKSAAAADVATPVIVIDPKIKTELSKALAFDGIPAAVEVLNPFIDRAGIGGTATASSPPVTSQAAASGNSNKPGNSSASFGGTMTQGSSFAEVAPFVTNTYSVKERHDNWVERQKRGEFVGPESEVLGVEDLVPVGFASGGDRADEVMLFSLALCRTFSFPAGTRFANGWLSAFDQNEVVFAFQDGVRRKSYSNAEPCQQNVNPGVTNVAGGQ